MTGSKEYDFIILSPGPKHPDDEAPSKWLVREFHERLPIFGICLGHQIICSVFGAKVEKIPAPYHGTKKLINTMPSVLFNGIGDSLFVATYNSLGVMASELDNLPLKVIAVCEEGEGEIVEALERDEEGLPYMVSTQFHPESFLSEKSEVLIRNFLERIKR